MREVEAESVLVHIRSCLFHMSSQHCSQCFLKKVGSTVVSRGKSTLSSVNLKSHLISHFDHALCHDADVADLAAQHLHCVFHVELALCGTDISVVPFLAAAGSIERGLVYKDGSLLSFGQGVHDLCLCGQYSHI